MDGVTCDTGGRGARSQEILGTTVMAACEGIDIEGRGARSKGGPTMTLEEIQMLELRGRDTVTEHDRILLLGKDYDPAKESDLKLVQTMRRLCSEYEWVYNSDLVHDIWDAIVKVAQELVRRTK